MSISEAGSKPSVFQDVFVQVAYVRMVLKKSLYDKTCLNIAFLKCN